jgi:hypothetical protein
MAVKRWQKSITSRTYVKLGYSPHQLDEDVIDMNGTGSSYLHRATHQHPHVDQIEHIYMDYIHCVETPAFQARKTSGIWSFS